MNRTQIVKKSLNFEDPGIVPYSIYLTEEGYGLYGDRLIDDYGNEKIQTDYRQGKLSQKEAASLAIGNFILYAEAPWWDWINLPAEFKEEDTPEGLPDTIGKGSYEAFFEKVEYLKKNYYFPKQLNNYFGEAGYTYFGFDPDVTPEEVKERIRHFGDDDTRITELSRAYRIELGTGWYTPAGVIHAPASVLTYEPQWNSDVNSVYENIVSGEVYPPEMLDEECPADRQGDIDYIFSLLDWEKNVDPHYRKHYFRPPVTASRTEDYTENWITYANEYIAAKELTVYPGRTVTIKDGAAYGCIFIQGHGKIGGYDAEAVALLRFGQQSTDEFFVSEDAAGRGVTITNLSRVEPLVLLKHFGPNHPDVPRSVCG